MSKKDAVRGYCMTHNLNFLEHEGLDAAFGHEEFEGIAAAGFYHLVGMGGPPMIVLFDDDHVEVLVAFADGERFLEDKFTKVLDDELLHSLRSGVQMHVKVL